MGLYPDRVQKAIDEARRQHLRSIEADAEGVAASFECGCFIRYSIGVCDSDGSVTAVFRTNGCGYMVAAGNVMAGMLNGKRLQDLHGLERFKLSSGVYDVLGEFPAPRQQCCAVAVDAVATVFAKYRRKRVDEFSGEKAVICTCFGVSEETIEEIIRGCGLTEVSEVSDACNAGAGCGSCRMLIQEMLDSARRGPYML